MNNIPMLSWIKAGLFGLIKCLLMLSNPQKLFQTLPVITDVVYIAHAVDQKQKKTNKGKVNQKTM